MQEPSTLSTQIPWLHSETQPVTIPFIHLQLGFLKSSGWERNKLSCGICTEMWLLLEFLFLFSIALGGNV